MVVKWDIMWCLATYWRLFHWLCLSEANCTVHKWQSRDWTAKLKQLQEDYWMEVVSISILSQSSITFIQSPTSFLLFLFFYNFCYMFFSVHWNQMYTTGIAVYSRQAFLAAVYGSSPQTFQLHRLAVVMGGGMVLHEHTLLAQIVSRTLPCLSSLVPNRPWTSTSLQIGGLGTPGLRNILFSEV